MNSKRNIDSKVNRVVLVRLLSISTVLFSVIKKMEGLLLSHFFVIHFSTLCTNAITLDDDGYDILSDAIQKGEKLPHSIRIQRNAKCTIYK